MVVYGIIHKRVAARTELGEVAITNSKNIKKKVSVCALARVCIRRMCAEKSVIKGMKYLIS